MIKRVIAFIDGENLVLRYQEMCDSGRTPRAGVTHIRDSFVWSDRLTRWSDMDLIRVNYYTSVTASQENVDNLAQTIASTQFRCSAGGMSGTARLLPHVHKKSSKSRKSSVVDIHLVVDAMRAVHTTDIDAVLIASGDGDFDQLLAEIGRSGKQAHLAAFSKGLDRKLRIRVEQFVDLDEIFFEVSR